jgi:GGDEF domain-containing protein
MESEPGPGPEFEPTADSEPEVVVEIEGEAGSLADAFDEDLAYATDDILTRGRSDYRDADVAVARGTAELQLLHGSEATRGVRQAAAGSLAPEAEIERRVASHEARTDALTGLPNYKAFIEALPAAEADPDTAVISFDGDNFGSINKLYGNSAGDAALMALGGAIGQAASDFESARAFRGQPPSPPEPGNNHEPRAFRTGGDEFYILAAAEDAESIIAAAQAYLEDRLHSEEPLTDRLGHEFPSGWYKYLGVSAYWGQTRAEADALMRLAKDERRLRLDHYDASAYDDVRPD